MKRIVIVEDETELSEMMASELEKMGFRVLTRADGQSGFKLINDCRPQLVILDLKIPSMSGIEIFNRLKTSPDLKHIPVLLMSGSEVLSKVYSAKYPHLFISKPFSKDALLHTVNQCLDFSGDF